MDFVSGWCRSTRRLEGCTAIVTGSNTGIGKETALDLYLRGARVILACRDIKKAEAAQKVIESSPPKQNQEKGTVIVEKLDLASLQSVRDFAAKIIACESNINILVNNAGIMCVPQGKTVDGFEMHMGTNHFGHALLTLLLLPTLRKDNGARVVFVSSLLHMENNVDFDDVNLEKTRYNPMVAYSRSKCANVLFSKALDIKLKEHNITNVTTYSLHPGVISTEIGRHFSDTVWNGATWMFQNVMSWFVKTPRCGAQTSIYCAVDEACAQESGLYYTDCRVTAPSKFCQKEENCKKFWEKTIEMLNFHEYNPFQV